MDCFNIPFHDGRLAGDVSQATIVKAEKLASLILNPATGGQAGLFAGLSR
jgi:hypothetical protein